VQYVCDQSAAVSEERTFKSVVGPAWQVEVDRATPADWSGLLDLFQDANLYQTWSYGAVRWGGKNLSHLVLKRNDEVMGMAQLRIVRPTRLNCGVAYLRWGPLWHRRGRELDPEAAVGTARALFEEYVCKRRLLLQILPNAFDASPRGELFKSAFSSFRQEPGIAANLYRTFVLDLSPALGELRRSLDAKWRNKLTQSEKKGLKVVAGGGIAEYRIFRRMYHEMWKRKAFETTVDVEEFARIQESLPETQRMRVLLCEQNGVPVAGIVTSAMGDSAIYLLGATSDDGLNARGAYLLQWTMIQWLKENGFRWYDLGGIDPQGNPGVYSFKKGLSGSDVSHLSAVALCNSVLSSVVVRASLGASRLMRSVAIFQGRVVR
jgi:hypothetical protein